jgi:uncharacterized OB-fold protein
MTDSRHRSAALHFRPQLHSPPTPVTQEIIKLEGADIGLAQLNETDYEKLRVGMRVGNTLDRLYFKSIENF